MTQQRFVDLLLVIHNFDDARMFLCTSGWTVRAVSLMF